ncbi:putative PLP-dependent enzyme possibly involved in cell wall biogenesis [Desulfocurvibacter africanus PCS]|uniref:Putative PLP-dependent enzyme possibly involved in cell wall biogenesis n=1 Tax=Desulfocurvibacter africanus PCS TaxID=1262666 RepID=M5PWQ2_DESAF|nr:DegT/DnrJ/EryC1/StrS family aminotransferase [Desulfocurvibacter africanus]EMG38410.1 putative PLP-dependent enzyme possibly involved in cell wall biogenesis [Desulfocurvibacter africanus PCS]
MSKLALLGGQPVRTTPFPAYVTAGAEEKEAAALVIDSGVLSRYLGCWHEQFYGGTEVQALEQEWAAYYGVKHAIAVNSCTSGLICALGAIGLSPGDEVIVTPWSMSISATGPLFYGGIPVFADLEPDYFCLSPASVEERISPRTKAIVVVDIFGQPYDAEAINAIARKHGIPVIEDCAQAPGVRLNGRYAGTLGDVGVFSLNYHKHIHCGEGGVIVTDSDSLAERLQLIRNHAEAVVAGKGTPDLTNMLGYNFRMTELDAALTRCQLKKLAPLLEIRQRNVAYLENGLKEIPCLTIPAVRLGAEHAYYVHACRYDAEEAGITSRRFVEAVKAELPTFHLREKEGTKLGAGYVQPLYLLPMFQQRIAIGNQGWPFTLTSRTYARGLCPVCEDLYEHSVITHEFMLPSMDKSDMDDVVKAFHKVWENRDELR